MINPETGRASLKRKPEIRRTAAREFRKHSYSGTSMDMIAAALNLNKGTLYVSVQQSVEWNDEIGVYFQEMRWLAGSTPAAG